MPTRLRLLNRADWWSLKNRFASASPCRQIAKRICNPRLRKPNSIAFPSSPKLAAQQSDTHSRSRSAARLNPPRCPFDLIGLPALGRGRLTRLFIDKPTRMPTRRLVDRFARLRHAMGERPGAGIWLDRCSLTATRHGYDKRPKIRPNAWPYRDLRDSLS